MTFGSCTYYSDPFIWVSPMRCIRGEIIDSNTNKPLSDIEITTQKEDNIVHSDSAGAFHIHLKTKTEYTLLINNTADYGYSQKDTVILDLPIRERSKHRKPPLLRLSPHANGAIHILQ